MDTKRIVILVLAMIPVLFCLFLVALYSVPLALIAVAALLLGLLVLRGARPDLFEMFHKKAVRESENAVPAGVVVKRAKSYVILDGRSQPDGCRITVDKLIFSIGRGPDNDYVLHGGNISRCHLKVEYKEDENLCYAVDQHSSNGTCLNGKRMVAGQSYRLGQGDRLMLDDRIFTVEYAHY